MGSRGLSYVIHLAERGLFSERTLTQFSGLLLKQVQSGTLDVTVDHAGCVWKEA